VFFGVALQDAAAALAIARGTRPDASLRSVRGREDTAVALPAIWVDLDVAGEGHSSNTLPPDRDAALALLDAVPCRPSIVVRTGGGFHVYWLFKEMWILDSAAERRAAKSLLQRVQNALRAEARRHGWSIDHTAELSRVLRLPGTFNHKTMQKQLTAVEELHLDRRYEASHFDALPGQGPHPGPLPQREREPEPPPGRRGEIVLGGRYEEPEEYDGAPADFARVRRGCPWMFHCDEDRESLPEPEWYAMLSIAGRCTGPGGTSGRELAHDLSRGHRGYTPAETDDKLRHALRDTGPRGCHHIAFELGLFDEYCDRCVHFGRIAGPIRLGRPEGPHPDPLPQREREGSATD
jgi:putative DNA primase/helicase